ncbi:MAG: M23 family metallopeptidase [Synechococcales cyanobacterium T60_A2020_003]|nr:M23 family metallopeptidase [Synechococcales cyanobacterium T60_A2020_003]
MARQWLSIRSRGKGAGLVSKFLTIGLWSGGVILAPWSSVWVPTLHAQTETQDLCPESALSRYTQHTVQAGETLESIAAQYNLLPATLLAFNPSLQTPLTSGRTLTIPPYNGIQVTPPAGSTWRSLAAQYQVRADLLFELNGCQTTPGTVVFIPGVNGFTTPEEEETTTITGYPLASSARILTGYGWQVSPDTGIVGFHSGIDLEAAVGDPVYAVGSGVVAYADVQGTYGKLVVINHSQGLQTRYAQLDSIQVTPGQTVNAGEQIGTAGMSGDAAIAHLHFEVRLNSDLGWVAEDPGYYIPDARLGRPIVNESTVDEQL